MGKEFQTSDTQSQTESNLYVNSERLSSVENTLIIIKPDGIQKGLVGEVVAGLKNHGLEVVNVARIHLERTWVETLYKGEEGEIYFKDVVAWVSSAPVLFMKVQGQNAVNLVKWDIIGRYPNGIRGRHSENWIQNVAHSPDSHESAQRELKLAEEIFEMRKKEDRERFRGIKVFALTGMSESGKSTVGKYLDSKGIPRLKIGKIFERVKNRQSPKLELDEFVKREEGKYPYALWDAFIDELMLVLEKEGVNMVSIESLYGSGFGSYLKQRMGDNFDIVYIDIPLEVRLRRQITREGLSSIEEAQKVLLPRDKIKADSGIPELRNIAVEIIDNSGTTEDLYRAVDEMVRKHKVFIDNQKNSANN